MASGRPSMTRRLLRNAGSSVGGFLFHFAIALFLFPFTVSHIGRGAYGLLVLAGAFVGYSGLLSFGLRPALIKLSAEHLERDDREAFHLVTGQVLFIYSLVAGLVVLLATIGVWLLPTVLDIPDHQENLFRIVLALVAIQGAVSLPGAVWTGLVEGLEDYHVAAAFRIGGDLLKVGVTVALLLSGYGLAALVVAYLFISVVQFVASWAWVRYRLPWAHIRPVRGSREELGGLMRFSGVMFLMSFSGSSENVADKFIIGGVGSPALVTVYEVGNRLSVFAHQLVIQITRVLVPTASALSARNDRNQLRRVLVNGSTPIVFVSGLLLVGLVAFGDTFIDLWMGPGYEESYTVLVLLMLSAFVASHVAVPGALCYGTGDLNVVATVSVIRMIANVALSVVLMYRWGIAGVALATLLTRTAQSVILMPYFSRIFEVSLRQVVWTGFFRSWLALAVTGAAAALLGATALAETWLSLILISLLTSAVGAAAFWTLSLTASERRRITNTLAARFTPTGAS